MSHIPSPIPAFLEGRQTNRDNSSLKGFNSAPQNTYPPPSPRPVTEPLNSILCSLAEHQEEAAAPLGEQHHATSTKIHAVLSASAMLKRSTNNF